MSAPLLSGLRRREDWPERLHACIEARRGTPFAWGIQDCVTFAAACVASMTDEDPLADLPAWGSREEADRALLAEGGLLTAVNARFAPCDPARASRGDLVLVRSDAPLPALGVCLGAFCAAPGEQGLQFLPMTAARLAWRVG